MTFLLYSLASIGGLVVGALTLLALAWASVHVVANLQRRRQARAAALTQS